METNRRRFFAFVFKNVILDLFSIYKKILAKTQLSPTGQNLAFTNRTKLSFHQQDKTQLSPTGQNLTFPNKRKLSFHQLDKTQLSPTGQNLAFTSRTKLNFHQQDKTQLSPAGENLAFTSRTNTTSKGRLLLTGLCQQVYPGTRTTGQRKTP